MQPRHHYETAFQDYLRARRIPYIAVNEARKALLPDPVSGPAPSAPDSLKSFDFVIYGNPLNLLVEIKGRKVAARPGSRSTTLQNWATQDDLDALLAWERLFGDGFRAALVFIYWCQEQPPTPLFEDLFESRGRWYAVRAVLASDYAAAMKPRSPRWRTVHMSSAAFTRLSQPLSALAAPERTDSGANAGAALTSRDPNRRQEALHPAGSPVAFHL